MVILFFYLRSEACPFTGARPVVQGMREGLFPARRLPVEDLSERV